MDWQRRRDEATVADPYGLTALLGRMEREIGAGAERLNCFTFLQDSRRMLAFSRQIGREMTAANEQGPLYVDFQNADKFHGEADRYRRLRGATDVPILVEDPAGDPWLRPAPARDRVRGGLR